MNEASVQPDIGAPPAHTNRNVWPVFISYRRSDATRKVALELKKELEASTIEASTGQVFSLDVFVDVAEGHQSDFQAHLVPHLQHSRALIVLADDGAASRKAAGSVDYLYSELEWWATGRKKTPPIILQLDAKAGSRLVSDTSFSGWRKVSFMDCFWERWDKDGDTGKAEKERLLGWLRKSIRNYGSIIHIQEVRRLKSWTRIAVMFAGIALLAAGLYKHKANEAAERLAVIQKSWRFSQLSKWAQLFSQVQANHVIRSSDERAVATLGPGSRLHLYRLGDAEGFEAWSEPAQQAGLATHHPGEVIDPRNGASPHDLPGHDYEVVSAMFSEDGKLLASWDKGNMVRLWTVEQAAAISKPLVINAPIEGVAFTLDNLSMLVWTVDSIIQAWHVANGELLRTQKLPVSILMVNPSYGGANILAADGSLMHFSSGP